MAFYGFDFDYDPKDFESDNNKGCDSDDDFVPTSTKKKKQKKRKVNKKSKNNNNNNNNNINGGNTTDKRGKKRKLSNVSNGEPKTKRTKRGWSNDEESKFLDGLNKFGRKYKLVSKHIGTRDVASVRSHMQIHLLKLLKNRKALPDKVKESGNGYTLSGRPLNKYSSTVLKLFKSPNDVPMDLGGVISDEESAKKLLRKDKNGNKINNDGNGGTSKAIKKVRKDERRYSDDEYNPGNNNGETVKLRVKIDRKAKNVNKHKHNINGVIDDEYELREDIIIYKDYNDKYKDVEGYQPWKIYYCPNALLIGDIHSHLCKEVEIMGLIGGEYNRDKRELYIKKLYPLNEESQFEKSVNADAVDQLNICKYIENNDKLLCIGWYHSHPCFKNYPSNTDLYQHFQQKSENEIDRPYIGLILSSWSSINTPKCDYKWFNSYKENNGEYIGYQFNVHKKVYYNINDINLLTQITNLIDRYNKIKYNKVRTNLNSFDWLNDKIFDVKKLYNIIPIKLYDNIRNNNNTNNIDTKIDDNKELETSQENDENKPINNDEDDIDLIKKNNNKYLLNTIPNIYKILCSLLLNMDYNDNTNNAVQFIDHVFNSFKNNKQNWFK